MAEKIIYDTLGPFPDGLNDLIAPLLLPKTTLTFARNATVRGGFIRTRPPFTNALSYIWPTDEVQTAVRNGKFQGGGYYQPDTGPQCLIAQITGRLFQFSITVNTITVTEITVPGDPNQSDLAQVWMWQAENYMIINNGVSLPIFYDGNISRRSYGPSVQLGSATTITPGIVPAIGGQVVLNLAAPYTGPYNVPVLFNGEYYQPTAVAIGYQVDLTSLVSTIGDPINVGDQIIINPNVLGVTSTSFGFASGTPFSTASPPSLMYFTQPYTGLTNGTVQIRLYGKLWHIIGVPGGAVPGIQIQPLESGTYGTPYPAGTAILSLTTSFPITVVGTVAIADVAPATGATVRLNISNPFTGVDGTTVLLDTGEYTIAAVPPPVGALTLILINLTDSPGGNYIAPESVLSVPELPPGRMGAYGLCQNAVCLTDGLSFIASDISRGPSGTAANNYRDSVLKTVDTTFRGGNFAISGAGNFITSMVFPAVIDTSFGQGALQIGTAAGFFSCLWPIDFTNPPPNGSPILTESLKGTGSLGQNNTVLVNSDTLFRSGYGLGSLRLARRQFDSESGNTPISEEVTDLLKNDNVELLGYGSGMVFDNRYLMTTTPAASSQGIGHGGAVAINLDPASSLRGKAPPVYDGLWDGINILQYITGIFTSRQRGFAFVINDDNQIEVVELLTTSGAQYLDNGSDPIEMEFATAALFNSDIKPDGELAQLREGEFAVDSIPGGSTVRFDVSYKADQGDWRAWHSFTVTPTGTGEFYYPRLGLGIISSNGCNENLDTVPNQGYSFQVKFKITGKCRFLRAKFSAILQAQPTMKSPICNL